MSLYDKIQLLLLSILFLGAVWLLVIARKSEKKL